MDSVFEIIKRALWGHGNCFVDKETYCSLINHSIDLLPASVFLTIDTTAEIKKEWNTRILRQISYNMQCNYLQNHLPITVPYAILKGTSVSQYYPFPEYRTLGDIDIITRKEDFDQAYQDLVSGGYTITKELEREITFVKKGIPIELHHFFASLNDPKQAKYMDDLIISNINASHILPDEINGLVLLEHINQHLERGLGLRQIVDWMMFVDKCLPDNKWPSFSCHARKIGLDNLAIVSTKMCELYLDLPHRKWCDKADEKLCKQLMEYVMACGNFGNTRSNFISTGENVFYYSNTPRSFIKLLQARGLTNWKAARDHATLRPFAWLYQIIRYIRRGVNREDASATILNEYVSAKQRKKMFEALGVRQSTKGLSVYRNGKYRKSR